MYYTDISNSELQQFHNLKAHNFTATLTQILTSPLFKVEEIITDSIYKIYPLFYTGEITSSNSDDKILDNKCIICSKTEDETYYTFISDSTQDVIDYIEYGTYYDVGDSLTTSQFNGYVSLLRQFVTHDEDIHIAETITGLYGTYEFDISDTTLLDTGMVVTDETISAEPKVRLTAPTFVASEYILILSVLHFTGTNIFDDDTDFIAVDTIEITLAEDKWVDIPVTTIEQGYIIDFDCKINISHNKPVIQGSPTHITITGDKTIIQTSDVLDLSAKVKDSYNPLQNVDVYFYEAYEPTLLTLTGDKSIIQTNDVLDLKATLKDEDGSLIEGETVYFYQAEDIDYYAYYETIDEGDNIEELALPSKFKIEFDLEVTGTSSTSNAFIRFNSSSGTYCGKGSSTSNNISFGSNVLEQITNKTRYTIVYNGTDVVFSSPTNSITVNNVTLTSLYSLSRNGATVMDNIRITDLSED